MRKRKKLFVYFGLVAGLSLLVILYCDNRIRAAAKGKTFSNTNDIPHNHVGLLLGTSKYLSDGQNNPYYVYRIEAAATLLKAGKIDYLIISGDNSRKEYNEPKFMRDDLTAAGIDSSRLYLDYAGFRTFDSMIRLRKIFSQDTVTVISQKFHNERALFIAQREGVTAVGFNAKDVTASVGLRMHLREKLARVKLFTDYLFRVEPKFLGPKVNIPQN